VVTEQKLQHRRTLTKEVVEEGAVEVDAMEDEAVVEGEEEEDVWVVEAVVEAEEDEGEATIIKLPRTRKKLSTIT
jgi:hypothetical protein